MPAPAPTPMQEDEVVYRLAALVARGISSEELLEASARELQRLLSVQTVRLAVVDVDGGARIVAETPLGQRAERIMEAFSELLAMTVRAEGERARVQQLQQEQRALRSVAMLVASGISSEGLFSAVTRAAGEVLGADTATLARFAPDGGVEYVATWARSGEAADGTGPLEPAGDGTSPLDPTGDGTSPLDPAGDGPTDDDPTGDDPTCVSTPVTVEGRLWGAMAVSACGDDPLPSDATERLSAFTELLGTAVGAVSSREQLARLAGEEAALRRVATLVAQGSEPQRVFAAVTQEVGLLLDADLAALGRVDAGRSTFDVVATWNRSGDPAPHARSPLAGENVIAAAAATGAPARQSDFATATGPLIELARALDVTDSVAVPIIVQGSVWGVIAVAASGSRTLQTGAELRLSDFTELVAAAIANAESRDELAASRARIVAAADDARARIERDLHECVQQRLVSLGLSLRTAVAAVPASEPTDLRETLDQLTRGFADAYAEIQEIARGIHPALLAEGGLRPAVAALARRSRIPVRVEIPELPRLPDQLEVAAYYAASEALTNALKHAQPSVVDVVAGLDDGVFRLCVTDDGVGGADPSAGTGLLGLRDRIEALSGAMQVTSAPGAGTSVSITLPVSARGSTP